MSQTKNEEPERWAVIARAPKYEVSTYGRVRRYRTKRILSIQERHSTGYLEIKLPLGEGKRKTFRIHKLVAWAFLGEPPPDKPEVRHLDGRRQNARLTNLCYGTRAENIADIKKHADQRFKDEMRRTCRDYLEC